MAKPLEVPSWATDGTNNAAPSTVQRATGWTPGQDGVSSYDNWFKERTTRWLEYLDGILSAPDAGVSHIGPETGASIFLSGGGRYRYSSLAERTLHASAFHGSGYVWDPTVLAGIPTADVETLAYVPLVLDEAMTIQTVSFRYLVAGSGSPGFQGSLHRQSISDPATIETLWIGALDTTTSTYETMTGSPLHVVQLGWSYYLRARLLGVGNRFYGATFQHYY